jgi:hypothetical protein
MKKVIFSCDICGKEWDKDLQEKMFTGTKLFLAGRQVGKNLHIKPADICEECFNAVNVVINERKKI